MTELRNSDFFLEVARGEVAGCSAVNKFGSNLTTDAGDDIWSKSEVYSFYPTSAQAIEIVSSVTTETMGANEGFDLLLVDD